MNKRPTNLKTTMIFNIYAIYDELSHDYGSSLYAFANDDLAKRWFRQILVGNILPKDRKDLSLYVVGIFDNADGSIKEYKGRVVNGGDFEND